MPMNRNQFQQGLSMQGFFGRYGSDDQCAAVLRAMRWPDGFRCPRCDGAEHYAVGHGARRLFQCQSFRHQTSLTSGTVLDSTKLPQRAWFLALRLISQDKTVLSSVGVMRHLSTSYRTARLVHHKLMAVMAEFDALQPLAGDVQLDDGYLGGEHPRMGGRGSPNKVPIVAAVSTNEAGRLMRVKLAAVGSFSREAISNWAKANLLLGCDVRSDGLSCFAGVIDAGCVHSFIVGGQRKPRDMPRFTWDNTILGNIKTTIGGGYMAFKFSEYANHYLGVFANRFNHRVNLKSHLLCLIGNAATCSPTRESQIRKKAEVHHYSGGAMAVALALW